MAGSVTDPRAGVGSALQRARAVRGLSLDEAARDTRLRVDQLDALEREDFDVLPGEVYVRASLRTYANYLGLDADKVSDAYARTAAAAEPAPPPARGVVAAKRRTRCDPVTLCHALSRGGGRGKRRPGCGPAC